MATRGYNPAMPPQTPIEYRDAARVLLLDREDRLLLFRCQAPGADRAFWITPGGGLEGGESYEDAARRELREETGLADTALGPCVWTRTHTFDWLARRLCQHERFYLVRCEAHDVSLDGHSEEEREVLTDHHWWSANEIIAAGDKSFAPRGLGELLAALLAAGAPSEPIDVGV